MANCFPYCLKGGDQKLWGLSCFSVQKIGRSKADCFVLGFPSTSAHRASCMFSPVGVICCWRCCTLPTTDPGLLLVTNGFITKGGKGLRLEIECASKKLETFFAFWKEKVSSIFSNSLTYAEGQLAHSYRAAVIYISCFWYPLQAAATLIFCLLPVLASAVFSPGSQQHF